MSDDGSVTVEVELPEAPDAPPAVPVVETPAETPAVVVVEGSDNGGGGDATQAMILEQLMELKAENERMRNELSETRATADSAHAAASDAIDIAGMESDATDSAIQAIDEQIAEVTNATMPEDIKPNNSHVWFRTKDEWKS